MRKLTKNDEPPVLQQNADTWTQDLLAAEWGTCRFRRVQNQYKNPEIRDRLREETHRKCAYCETRMEMSSYSHIEHIFPKEEFMEKTFLWNNLTLSCQVCNTKKGRRVPSEDNFVHPYEQDPHERLKFVGPFIKAALGNRAANNMVNWLDLNRGELIIRRSEIVKHINSIYETAIRLPPESRREFLDLEIERLTSAEYTYSCAAICYVEVMEIEYAQAINGN